MAARGVVWPMPRQLGSCAWPWAGLRRSQRKRNALPMCLAAGLLLFVASAENLDEVTFVTPAAEVDPGAMVVIDESDSTASQAGSDLTHLRIFSPYRVETVEALKAEVIAVEAALALRATVDGPPAVYDSPSVSIALRKVSPEVLANEWVDLKAPDGAELSIPPGAKQRHGGPVTITITSYHTGGRIKKLPGRVKFGKGRQLRRKLGGDEAISGTKVGEDRVDFFLEKEEATSGPARHSVSWAGTVDVKVRDPTKGRGKVKGDYEMGLGVQVPAHHTDYQFTGNSTEDSRWPEERQALLLEVEGLAGLPDPERQRGYRKLARKWHPDKNPDEKEKSSVLFHLLQELRARLLPSASSR